MVGALPGMCAGIASAALAAGGHARGMVRYVEPAVSGEHVRGASAVDAELRETLEGGKEERHLTFGTSNWRWSWRRSRALRASSKRSPPRARPMLDMAEC